MYKTYFRKKSNVFVVKSRGLKKISDYIDFEVKSHECERFCLNDRSNVIAKIRLNESKFMILDEGLIMTYPTEKVLSYFKRLYMKYVSNDLVNAVFPGTTTKVSDFRELFDDNESVSPLLMICVPVHDNKDAKRLLKIMTDEFAKTGYYMTSYNLNDTSDF